MARRPTRDSKGNILPLRKRQPFIFWATIIISLAMVLSLMATALLVLVTAVF